MRNIAFSDLTAYLMHGREIEFTYKGRKYSITNHSDHWNLCDDIEHILFSSLTVAFAILELTKALSTDIAMPIMFSCMVITMFITDKEYKELKQKNDNLFFC